jgi:hypothetical protein
MPTTNTEKNHVADFLKRELEPLIGRKLVTVVSGAGVLKKGAVLGTVTASGKMNYYDPTSGAGLQLTTAGKLAILLEDIDATAADVTNVRVAWALGAFSTATLIWGAGVTTQPHKDAAYAGLALSMLVPATPA